MTSNPYADDATAAIPGVPHRWNALTVALTAIGFIVFWPLGLAMIAYVVWGEKIAAFARSSSNPLRSGGGFSGARQAAEDFGRNMRSEFGGGRGFGGFGARPGAATGNAAFDAWRDAELKRLDEERRKIDAATAEFEAHLRAERGGHDESRQREEFDRFMQNRNRSY